MKLPCTLLQNYHEHHENMILFGDDSLIFSNLEWWKVNNPKFSILSIMTRHLLVILVSTVASKSVFGTNGWGLDPFSNFLTLKTFESLIYAQDRLQVVQMIIPSVKKIEKQYNKLIKIVVYQ